MPKLLIMARDSDGTGAGQYKKGDVVYIYPDGYNWQKSELSDMFVRVNATTGKVSDFAEYRVVSEDADGNTLRKRAIGLDTAFVDSLIGKGVEVDKTKAQLTAVKVTHALVVEP
jgi:hypothetical protein